MSDIDDIEAKIAALLKKSKGNSADQFGGEIARLTFAKQNAERRALEASIKRRARLNRGAK